MDFQIKNNISVGLKPFRKIDNENHIELKDSNGRVWLELKHNHTTYEILVKDSELDETEESLTEKIDKLIIDIIEAEQSGTEFSENDSEEQVNPFNPEDIKVHAKQFSLTLISEMIDDGDIDLSPNFQRNLVWNSFQKSRLIESILLRIPLPMFYFSEDNQGKITIVDGLQRLTTIKEFMENKFPLKKLEYLGYSCDGRYFEDEGNKEGIDAKYKRWFKQTQFSVNVIDPSSPHKVKYDIFRRINTGGKPLNNQEIRNCLAGTSLRNTIQKMSELIEFKEATDYSIKPTRMEDQEVAMRFILFYSFLEADNSILAYNGYINQSLDYLTEVFLKKEEIELEKYVSCFSNAMKNSKYLFGRKYAFRKVRPNDTKPNSHKQLINKALFVCWSILLAQYDPEKVKELNKERTLLMPLAERIQNDSELLYFLSYGTNGRNNLLYTFEACNDIISKHLNY